MECLTRYVTILDQELSERRLKNPSYSQAAFARDLNLSPGRLSEILKGKQRLSSRAAFKIAEKLRGTSETKNYFVNLVRFDCARTKTERIEIERELDTFEQSESYHQVEHDSFKVVSDWTHFAITELTKLKSFQSSSEWMAKTLGVSVSEIVDAVERLKRIGLLKLRNGQLIATDKNIQCPGGIPSHYIKRFHEQVLKKAIVALHNQEITEREFSTTLIALDRKKLSEFKKHIDSFWKDIDEKASKQTEKNDVYCLSVQLFNITSRH